MQEIAALGDQRDQIGALDGGLLLDAG